MLLIFIRKTYIVNHAAKNSKQHYQD